MKHLYNGKYSKIKKIGSGSFGTVHLVEDVNTHIQYAMKKFYIDNLKEDSVINQYTILKTLSNDYFIDVIEHFKQKDNQYLITGYYANNLDNYIKSALSPKIIKAIIYHITKAVQILHNNNYIHRDIKPDNILLDNKGHLKLTDFDLIRKLPENSETKLTRNVVTLYYRAPEIFYGDLNYGKSLDVWSIGCVFGELCLGYPLFKGRSELDTLGKIVEMLGTPCEKNWEGVSELPNYLPFKECEGKLEGIIKEKLSDAGKELLMWMLKFDPRKRPSCEEILEHKYFKEDDGVCEMEEIVKEMGLK
jgi:serine/threonine protein kinase